MRRLEWIFREKGRWEKIEIELIKEPIEVSLEFHQTYFMDQPFFSAKKAFND